VHERDLRDHGTPGTARPGRHARDGTPGTARPGRHARDGQPWYTAKREPAFEDMLTQLRRVLICHRISGGSAAHPTPAQTRAVLAAWEAAAA
jgi:hypothetical protein